MHYIVYKTTNLSNGRFYVGVHGTEDPEVFDGYFGTGSIITEAIKKYGKHKFIRETLIDCFGDEEEAYSIEEILVKTNKEDPRSYNVMKGGRGCFNHNRKSSEEIAQYLSSIRKSNATGLKKYNDGNFEYHFASSDRTDKEQTNKEFKEFLENNKQYKAGRIKIKIKKKSNILGTRKYNNGINEFSFFSSNKDNIELTNIEFDNFIKDNPQFTAGTISKGKRHSVSPMIGAKKYHDGFREFLFRSSNMSNKILTNEEFSTFITNNPNYYPGRLKPVNKDKISGFRFYNNNEINYTFRYNNIKDDEIIDKEFSKFLLENPQFSRGLIIKIK